MTPEQDGYLARYAALVNSTGLSNDTLGATIIAVNLELAALRKQVEKLTTERDNARSGARGWKLRVDEAADVVGSLEVQVEAQATANDRLLRILNQIIGHTHTLFGITEEEIADEHPALIEPCVGGLMGKPAFWVRAWSPELVEEIKEC